MIKHIVSFSGGMDSATLLGLKLHQHIGDPSTVIDQGPLPSPSDILAVGFHYGSKHNPYEQQAARDVCEAWGVPYRLIDLSTFGQQVRSNLMSEGGDIPEGHYEAASMSQTVVPGRNTVFASVLMGIAQSEGAGTVSLGIHSGDHAIYPDCRPEWFDAMAQVYEAATEGAVTLLAPLLKLNKTSILEMGYGFPEPWTVPYSLTRTCYKAQEVSCGRCGACQERLEAFRNIGKDDPQVYEFRGDLSA